MGQADIPLLMFTVNWPPSKKAYGVRQCAIRKFYLFLVHSSPLSLDQVKCHLLCDDLLQPWAFHHMLYTNNISHLELNIIMYVVDFPRDCQSSAGRG